MLVKIGSMAWFLKSAVSVEDLFLMKRRLTIMPRKTSEFSDPRPIVMWKEDGDLFGIPREYYFGLNRTGDDVKDCTSHGSPLNPSLKPIVLRSYQERPVDIIYDHLKDHYGCSFEGNTASGKTVCSLEWIRRLGRTALVVVHKSTLAEQWFKRIKGDPNEKEEILRQGFLPDAKVGFVGDGKFIYKGCDIVIGMIQTLALQELDEEFCNYFGTLVVDELHRSGAEKWGNVAPKINSRFRIGVSATIRRKDGAEKVFSYHIGGIEHKVSNKGMMKPDVYVVDTGFKIIDTPNFNPDELSKSRLLPYLVKSKTRTNKIVNEIMNAVKKKRVVLAVSDRVEHLETFIGLVKFIREKEGLDFSIGEFYKGGRKVTKGDLEEARKRDLIFGTYKMIEDGEDIKKLDCLFLLTPCSDAQQLVGRILRESEGKKTPIVVDFWDDVARCRQMYLSRKKFYVKQGWKVFEVNRK